jgi:hypothetical protein
VSTEIALDFLAGTDLSSRAIELFGFPQGYSHVASMLADGRYLDSRSGVLDGVPGGVHIRNPASEKWLRKRRATFTCTPGEYDAWEANLRAKITTGYDVRAILGFILDKNLHGSGQWICSALAINALQHIRKIPYPLIIPAHEVSPDLLLVICQVAGATIGPEVAAP